MDVRPIRTDEDHVAALAEIECLWGAPQNAGEADRLDLLATLVEAYEERRWPMPMPEAVEAIETAVTGQDGR